MDTSVGLRNPDLPTDIIRPIAQVWEDLTVDEQYWVDYRACQGIRFTEDGKVSRMTVLECAEILGVSDTTLRNWERRIERFRDLTAWRRAQLYSDKVVGAAWAASALKAAQGDDAAVERILTNFDPNYKSAKAKLEVEAGESLVEIFSLMRKEAQIIDGEYTEADPGSGPVDSQERPASLPEQS